MKTTYHKRKHHFLYLWVVVFFLLLFLLMGKEDDKSLWNSLLSSDTPVPQKAVSQEAASQEISLLRCESGEKETMDLENYIIGVVAAEVPPKFEEEAIKAQAIVARTYAMVTLKDGGELCDFYGHCQAYYDTDALKERWGEDFDANYQRYQSAVMGTAGTVVTYQGALAKTYFHSTCGGKTSSAKEVWGGEVPYLQSVACNWDKEAPRYKETVTVSQKEVNSIFGAETKPVVQSLTQSGRVAAVSVGDKTVAATDFRKSLALNSTNFTLDASSDSVKITTKGYGHGVGLCQYGANGMAKEGRTAKEIICHYYQGVEIQPSP